MTIALAAVAGIALGFVLSRGDFCFHSTWRQFFASPSNPSLLRAYVVLLLVSTPVVQLLIAMGVIAPFVPSFAPAAAIGGGLLFGAGMVIAKTCISGMFYKLGNGMLGMVVALAAWATGDIVTWRGPLKGIRESLTSREISASTDDGGTSAATISSLLGLPGILLLIVVAAGLAVWSARGEASESPESLTSLAGAKLGVATAVVMTLGWLLATWHGFNYSFGTSSVPSQIWASVVRGEATNWWIPLGLISIVPGAFIAATTAKTLWVRGEQTRRFAELSVGGFVMGVGAAIAGGCNLGHSMVGVPLLSIGSIVTTLAIAAGVYIASRIRSLSQQTCPAPVH